LEEDAMKIRLFSLVALLATVLAAPVFAAPFAQLSSTETQEATTTPQIVTLNSNDGSKGIDNNKGKVTIKEAGSYFLMAAGQIGGNGKGTVRLWMRQNGKDVGNSNTEQTIENDSTSVIVCQGVAECKAGDTIELAFSASAPGLKLVYSKAENEPAIPSMIFSAVKVDAGPFAQLSSTESQPAESSATRVTLNSTDAAKEIENNKGVVTIKDAGVYFCIAAGQVGATKSGAKGTVKLWTRLNGTDVDNSNTEQSIAGGSTAVLICQGVGECKAGDKLELMQSSKGSGLGIVFSEQKGEPAIPSMIFSTFKVPAKAYAQLCSLKTQDAAAMGKPIALEQTDAAAGVENAAGAVTIKDNGVYLVVAAGQVGGNGRGTVKLWMRQNGTDVGNSNTEQTVVGGSTSVIVCQGVMELKAGDKLQLVQSAKGSGVGMVASKPDGEPAIPSVIFSLVKID
jgi:hypothetical protein